MYSASMLVGSTLTSLHRAGFAKLAAAIANASHSGREFSIDQDGDWLNKQPGVTFASPDPHMVRLSFVDERTREAWLYAYSPQPTDIVFDVGAGIGEEALVLAKLVKHVYAIEAHPRTYRCLVKTIEMSGCSNVTPIQCALADIDGFLEIGTGANHLASSIISLEGNSETVPARTLTSLCGELGVAEIDYLKMNIEGAERMAIKGFGNVPIHNLAISCHDFIQGEKFRTRTEVTQFLKERGYRLLDRREDVRPWTREMVFALDRT